MPKQLEVIKTDGSRETYLYTKVLGTISNALSRIDRPDVFLAQELADVVTYYLYHHENAPLKKVQSNEILSIIKVVLTTTGHADAAAALSEYHYERLLKRNRVEVVYLDINDLTDAQSLCTMDTPGMREKWSKTRIVADLIQDYGISRLSARAVASMVEEKIFKMDLSLVPSSLIKLLVLNDAAMILRAQDNLHQSA